MRRNLHFYYTTLSEWDVAAAVAEAPGAAARTAAWFAEYGGGSAFLFSSARASLRALLVAAGIGHGDDVVVCGFTCLAVPEAVRYAGATAVYSDLGPASWSSGAAEVARAATAATRAVVVQHTFGIPAPLDDVLQLCRERGWLLIEDCALALGSCVDARALGSFGDAAIFSFELSKTVTAGWGGVAIVRDAHLSGAMENLYAREQPASRASTAREVIQVLMSVTLHRPAMFPFTRYLIAALYRSGLFRLSGQPLADVVPSGWSHRLSATQSALVHRQLRRLGRSMARRDALVTRYRAWLDETARPDSSGTRAPGVHLIRFPLLVEDPSRLVHLAQAIGIEIGRWFDAPVAPMPQPPSRIGYDPGSCPTAERVCRSVVNLPMHPRMRDADADRVVDLLQRADVRVLPLSAA